ncbi:MAG: flippase [Candidatus Hatepunaea meridiana]|nr:flippase [Candidatus Hatepunaea meridiana]
MGGMFVLRISSQIATLVTFIIISRMLGPEDFGRYSFLYGMLIFLTLFNVNGLNDILVRDMASQPDRRDIIYRNGLTLKLIAGVFTFLLACFVFLFFNLTDLPRWVSCIAALTLFVSFSIASFRTVWDVPYQVDFRMTSASAVNLAGRILFLGLLVLWILKDSSDNSGSLFNLNFKHITIGVTAVIILQTFSEFSATGMQGVLNLKYKYRMLPGWDVDTIRYLLREVWPLAISGGLGMIFTKINLLMLQHFHSEIEVGLYAVPMRLVEALCIIATVFIAALLPILSKTYKESKDRYYYLVKLCYKAMFIVSFPIIAVIYPHSETIMVLLIGEAYIASAPVLTYLIWSTALIFTGGVLAAVLLASGKQRLLMYFYAIQAVVCIILCFVLIPEFGIVGAAWVVLITNIVIFPITLMVKEVNYTGKLWFKTLIVPLLSAFAAGYIVKLLDLNLLPALFITPALFFSFVLIARWINKTDILFIRNHFGTK